MARPLGGDPRWWWEVARHLDAAQLALANTMPLNLNDQAMTLALQDKMREAQVILLEIFRTRGLLPIGLRDGAAGAAVPPSTAAPGAPECTEDASVNGHSTADQKAALYELVAEVLPSAEDLSLTGAVVPPGDP